jgi:alkanesulfonate monooxygenase SsuD/methylene tetrahydromethanopterin reductase-like flavin-dependent oxidoreductase (luciferase family)
MTRSTLRYGLYLPPFGPFGDARVLIELAQRAEQAGWDGVFLWDHVTYDALPIVDPWTALAAIAQATSALRLGPMVTPPARRRPWLLARQAATLADLSGGRLVLGTGLGSDESGDFARYGEITDLPTRSVAYDEALDLMAAVWSGLPGRHEGRTYSVDLPAAKPPAHRIPVWIGSSGDSSKVVARAARHDGIFPNRGQDSLTPDEVRRLVGRLRNAGLPPDRPFDIAVSGDASPAWGDPVTVDLPALARAGATWWMESLIHIDPLELSLKVVDAGPPRD